MLSEFLNPIIDLFLLNPVAQTSGFIGMICVWIAFLQKDDLKTIKILLLASFFWGIMFILLKSYSGLVASIISTIRLLLSIKYKKNFRVFLFLSAIIALSGIIVYDGYISLLPIIGSFIGAYSFLYFSGIMLRIWCLALSIIWLVYHSYIGSIGGVLNEIVVEILILFTIYKYIGINGYQIHFMSRIKSIFNPYHDIDYGRYTVISDKDKISTKYNIRKKLYKFYENLINIIRKNIKIINLFLSNNIKKYVKFKL